MTRRQCLLIGIVLVCTTPILGQSRGAESPIAGVWKGELVRDGASSPKAVTLTLKADGKGKVSGTVDGLPLPAEVKDGSFDAKTGALKLSLGKVGETAVLLVLEGNVANGKASGTVAGEDTGTFSIARQK